MDVWKTIGIIWVNPILHPQYRMVSTTYVWKIVADLLIVWVQIDCPDALQKVLDKTQQAKWRGASEEFQKT